MTAETAGLAAGWDGRPSQVTRWPRLYCASSGRAAGQCPVSRGGPRVSEALGPMGTTSFGRTAESPRARWLCVVGQAAQEQVGPGPGPGRRPGCAVRSSGSCVQGLCRLCGRPANTDETLHLSLTLPETRLCWFRFCNSKNGFPSQKQRQGDEMDGIFKVAINLSLM